MKSILIVDDEQALVLALEDALAGAGYRTFSAHTGEDALLSLRDHRPDVVLLDIMMPGVGGLETLRILRSHPDFTSIPVILMSGARPLAKQDEYRWNVMLYKPFSIASLIKTIEDLTP